MFIKIYVPTKGTQGKCFVHKFQSYVYCEENLKSIILLYESEDAKGVNEYEKISFT